MASKRLGITWCKSSRSTGGNCVQVAVVDGEHLDVPPHKRSNLGKVVLVTDSMDPELLALAYTPAEWLAFVDGVKREEFDYFNPDGSEKTQAV